MQLKWDMNQMIPGIMLSQMPKIKCIRKKIYLPMFKGIFGEKPGAYLLHAKDWFDCQGVRYDQEKVHNFEHTLYLKPKNGMLTFSRKLL